MSNGTSQVTHFSSHTREVYGMSDGVVGLLSMFSEPGFDEFTSDFVVSTLPCQTFN